MLIGMTMKLGTCCSARKPCAGFPMMSCYTLGAFYLQYIWHGNTWSAGLHSPMIQRTQD